MQTLLPERSGARSIASLGRGLIEDGVPAEPRSQAAVDPEHVPFAEQRSYTGVASAPAEEGAESGTEAVITRRGRPPAVPRTHARKIRLVLGLPMDLSAREVVARAREQGLIISEPFVYKVRYDAKVASEPGRPDISATAEGGQSLELQEQALAPEGPKAAPPTLAIEEGLEREVIAVPGAEGLEGLQAVLDVPGATPANKADFILGLPRHFSVKEVLAEAEQQGFAIGESHVYRVRKAAKKRSNLAQPTKGAAARRASYKAAMESEAFVRSLPLEMSYAEAVAKADDAGIVLTLAQFYRFKSQASTRRVPAGATSKAVPTRGLSKPPPRAPSSKPVPPNVSSSKPVPSASSSRPVPGAPSIMPVPTVDSSKPAPTGSSSRPVPRASSSKPDRELTPRPASTHAFEGLRVASDDEREQALIDAIRVLGLQRARRVVDAVERFERVTVP